MFIGKVSNFHLQESLWWNKQISLKLFSITLIGLRKEFISSMIYTGWPRKNGTVNTVDFSGLCSNQLLFVSLCWIEHLLPIILTPRSSNLVENFFIL